MLNRMREKKERERLQREIKKIGDDLLNAAENGQWLVVTNIVKAHGNDPDVMNATRMTDDGTPGPTALILAARGGRIETVKALLEAPRINLHTVDFGFRFNTALLCAAMLGHDDVVKVLAAKSGINANAVGWEGMTALTYAVHSCPSAIRALLAIPGINVNAADPDKRTALCHAMIKPFAQRDTLPAYVYDLLYADNINLNAADKDGWTPLMFAAKQGDVYAAQGLLVAGADSSLRNHASRTASEIAELYGHKEVISLLQVDAEVIREAKNKNARAKSLTQQPSVLFARSQAVTVSAAENEEPLRSQRSVTK